MKKILICVLSLLMLISLASCGKDAAKDVDLQKIYDSYQEYLPDMMVQSRGLYAGDRGGLLRRIAGG